jgi:hypothetical protein
VASASTVLKLKHCRVVVAAVPVAITRSMIDVLPSIRAD